jgi:hypothetical protein
VSPFSKACSIAASQALAAEGKQEAAEAAAGVITLLADLGGQLAEALPQDGGPVAKSVSDVLGADALRRRLGGGLQLDSPQVGRQFNLDDAMAAVVELLTSPGVVHETTHKHLGPGLGTAALPVCSPRAMASAKLWYTL